MRDEKGVPVADNFYWIARDDESYRGLNSLAPASLEAQALSGPSVPSSSGEENTWNVRLKNTGASPALAMKLTLLHSDNTRVLPAYYNDNYISLLPGEERTIAVHVPSASAGMDDFHFTLRGWNFPERGVPPIVGQSALAR
jgi:Exo-beta-D-glucosaminidase Ig-fold domain